MFNSQINFEIIYKYAKIDGKNDDDENTANNVITQLIARSTHVWLMIMCQARTDNLLNILNDFYHIKMSECACVKVVLSTLQPCSFYVENEF